jgi:glycosyltransferase involved in cell wall biosynthesis
VRGSKNGFVVPAGDVDALYTAIAAYSREPEMAELHGGTSAKFAKSYEPDAIANRWVKLIEGLL